MMLITKQDMDYIEYCSALSKFEHHACAALTLQSELLDRASAGGYQINSEDDIKNLLLTIYQVMLNSEYKQEDR